MALTTVTAADVARDLSLPPEQQQGFTKPDVLSTRLQKFIPAESVVVYTAAIPMVELAAPGALGRMIWGATIAAAGLAMAIYVRIAKDTPHGETPSEFARRKRDDLTIVSVAYLLWVSMSKGPFEYAVARGWWNAAAATILAVIFFGIVAVRAQAQIAAEHVDPAPPQPAQPQAV